MANGSTCTASLLLLLSLFAAPIWTVSLVHVIEISDDYHNVQDAIEEIRAYTCQHHAQIQVRYIFDWEHFRGFSFILTTAHGSDIESDLLSGQLAQHDAVKDFWDLPEQPMPSSSNGRAKDKIGKRASLRMPTIGTFSGDEAVDRSSANSEGFSTNAMTGVNKLHADGIKGKGITIAVLDSCFDYKRDVFGNSIGADKKITYAYNWMSNSSDVYCTCDWHGAAVLGIIAANPTEYNIVGAAPESSIELHAFSGCDLDSGVPNDLIMHILTNVVKRKVDVINLSQNNIPTSRLTPFAVLLSRIQHSGIFVACSGGNSPHPTPFHIQEPATGVGVPAIGSVANTIVPYIFWGGTCSVNGKVRGQLEYIPWGSNASGPNFPSDLKVWTPSTDRVLSDPGARFYGDCHAAPTALPDWNETILLIGYTDCWNLRNNQTIQNAPGLKYLLQYNNKPSGSVSVVDDNFYTDPRYAGWGVIEWQQASSWVKLNSSGDFSVTLSNDASERRYSPVPNTITGGRVHFWSPWGPNFDGTRIEKTCSFLTADLMDNSKHWSIFPRAWCPCTDSWPFMDGRHRSEHRYFLCCSTCGGLCSSHSFAASRLGCEYDSDCVSPYCSTNAKQRCEHERLWIPCSDPTARCGLDRLLCCSAQHDARQRLKLVAHKSPVG